MTDISILPSHLKAIPLSKGKYAIVDAKNYDWLTKHKWSFDGKYAQRKEKIGKFDGKTKLKSIRMHREIMKADENDEVDHIDGDGLHNWENNLRIVSHQDNMFNMKSHIGSTSKYKGVCWNKRARKWEVQLTVGGKRVYQGYFDNEDKAAKFYNKLAEKYHSKTRRLNIITETKEPI